MRAADPHDRDDRPQRELLRSGVRGISAVAVAVAALLVVSALISLAVAVTY